MSEYRPLLLTDVVDSTRLAEALGETATANLWAEHDRVARDLLPVWRGREIDRTDGMLLLFEEADDALAYALAYQDAMSSLSTVLQVRVGLHVGPVVLRTNNAADVSRGAKPLEVEGAAKAATARIMSVALGGQILVSEAARDALSLARRGLRSHGHWQLKGLSEPVELLEAEQPGKVTTPPHDTDKAYRVVRRNDLWLPVCEIRHNLPAERDAFVGRATERATLSRLVQDGARLVSVLGIGGCGKTRMVTRFGWTHLGEFAGGVWFCDLSNARSEDGIVRAVALALDVPLGKADPVAQLANALASRGRCLVILDNFEQVTRHAEATLGRWLDRADQASFIVTTREVLGLPGEQALAVPPLAQPEAATLFMHRARAAASNWKPDAEDELAVPRLVALLDGLPLAIELAAARVRVMPPQTLLARMGERFKLLASAGGRQDRQATLRATFDWSWDLLSQADKAALAQLGVFQGGFSLDSAEAVLDLSAVDAAVWPTDAVQSLVDKSFVRAQPDGRFDLLVSVQDYALDHLRTEGRFKGSGPAAAQAAEQRHWLHFASYALRTDFDAAADLENLATGCRRAVHQGDSRAAAGALEGAWAVLSQSGPYAAGVTLAAPVCAMPGLDPRTSALAQRLHADALVACGRTEAAPALYADALDKARSAGDAGCETELLLRLGTLHLNRGHNQEARQSYEAALALARQHAKGRLEAWAINCLGNLERNLGRLEAAAAHYETALRQARSTGDLRMQGSVLGNMVGTHGELGQTEQALTRGEQSLAIARVTGNRLTEASTLCNLAMMLLVRGRPDESRAMAERSLVIAREVGHVRLECIVLCNLGIALEQLGHAQDAHGVFEIALGIAQSLNDRRMQGQILGYDGLLLARLGRGLDAAQSLKTGETLLREVSDPFSLGVLLCGQAEAALLSGDRHRAPALLAEAQKLAQEIEATPMTELGLAIARVEGLVCAGLALETDSG